jgi:penicillin-binding protein 1A
MLTLWLEHRLGKDEILARYLNTAYFGAGAFGVDAAAKRYFGKSAKELSLSEAAMLAGLVRAPSVLAPNRNLDGARARAALVLDAMVETGAISAAQADAARRQPVNLRVPPDNPPGANYFVDMLGGEVKRLIGPTSADLTLSTTLDLDLQSIAETIIARRLKAEGRAKKVGRPRSSLWRRMERSSPWWEALITMRASSIVRPRPSGSRARCSRPLFI